MLLRSAFPASALLAFAACGASPASAHHPALARAASFVAPGQDGAVTQVPRPAARATIVDFWAPDCGPCRTSLPGLARLRPRLEDEGVDLVLPGELDRGASIDSLTSALNAWGAPTAFLVDREGAIRRNLGFDRLPATVVLDGEGIVRWVAPEGASPEEMAAAARTVAGR